MASRLSISNGSPVLRSNRLVSRSKESARLCAGSTLMTRVRYPSRESCKPVAAARLVFPTPPLPLNRRMRILHCNHSLSETRLSDDRGGMFEWSNTYSVAIGSIDAQHQNLFAIGRELHTAMVAGQGKAALGRILDRLGQYTSVHFAHEERLMRLHDYPDLPAHIAEHAALTKQVKKFQEDFHSGRAAITVQ